MTRLVVLDSGPVGLLSKPPKTGEEAAWCVAWVDLLLERGTIVTIPEIARYEVRRELVRKDLSNGLRRLDQFCSFLAFLPIADPVMDRASDLWAGVRKAGLPTAPDEALDGDAILAAQALVVAESGGWDEVIIATPNVRHLSRFPGVVARRWEDII